MKTIWFLTNFLSPVIPPRTGDTYRVYNLSKRLVEAGHRVNIISFTHQKNSLIQSKGINEWRIHGVTWGNNCIFHRIINYMGFFLFGRPPNFSIVNLNSHVKKVIEQNLCDVIISGHIWVAPLAKRIAKALRVPLIIDSHNFYTELYFHFARNLTRRFGLTKGIVYPLISRLLTYEKTVLNNADYISCVSIQDKQHILRMGVHEKRIIIVPNGVDLSSFETQNENQLDLRNMLRIPKDTALILFLGSSSYSPNIEAVKDIREIIAPQTRNAIFVIIGKGWSKSRVENIVVLGEVDSVRKYLNAADVLIAPLRWGGGTKIKTLEYMAAGKPIIGTPEAFKGLLLEKDSVIIESRIDRFPEVIKTVLHSPEITNRLKQQSQSSAKKYSWEFTTQPLLEVIEDL